MKLDMGDALVRNAQRFPNKLALDEGYLHVSGRKKNMIKSAGISIFPEEIEGILRAHAI